MLRKDVNVWMESFKKAENIIKNVHKHVKWESKKERNCLKAVGAFQQDFRDSIHVGKKLFFHNLVISSGCSEEDSSFECSKEKLKVKKT
jgi:hypothetical protein